MNGIAQDIVEEGRRIVGLAEAENVALRLLGGVAVRLCCPNAMRRPGLERDFKDIDFAAPKKAARKIGDLLEAQGYAPDREFNSLHGASRLLFYDAQHDRQVDVFLGTFEMCHKLDLEPRLSFAGPSLPPSDLLLLKLQIVEANEKDITDALALLLEHEPVAQDGAEVLSTGYIARLCAGDWGWFTTLSDNLGVVRERATSTLAANDDAATVQRRVDALLGEMRAAPKGLRWRMRDRIGRRVPWYELPEEVQQ